MPRLKRRRWPLLKLSARYACVNGCKPMFFTCWMKAPYPEIYGRPKEVFCDCGEPMEYEGFVRRG